MITVDSLGGIMATMLGLRHPGSRYTCPIRHSTTMVCDHCRAVERKRVDNGDLMCWLSESEQVILSHYRGDCHDGSACPACATDREVTRLTMIERRVRAAWDEGL